jgi:UDP-glucose 4-epimerase
VRDLSRAHILGLDYLRNGGESVALNLGTGKGYSVAEVVNASVRITGNEISVRKQPRREGDLANVVANARLAKKILGWSACESDLDSMIQSSWDWLQSHPDG